MSLRSPAAKLSLLSAVVAALSTGGLQASGGGNNPPVFAEERVWTPGSNYWIVEGRIVDEGTCGVMVDGVVADWGQTDSEGRYFFGFQLWPGYTGPVYIGVMDDAGNYVEESNWIGN